MCKPPKTPKPDILPDAPPPPEEAPVAPEVNDVQSTSVTKRKGRMALRIDLNPAVSASVGSSGTALRI